MTHSLDPLLKPKSIAVVGASRKPGSIGWQILDKLLSHNFTGAVYPVNPSAKAIHSIKAYPSVDAIGEPVDLAIIVVPAAVAVEAAKECVEAGVKALVMITAGFKEIGGLGAERERELMAMLDGSGVRLVGPNCMGVINTAEDVKMDATFAPAMPPPGPVAFISQSGAMGVSILDYAESLGIGMSKFVSSGNKADVSGNDLLEYWTDDPDTQLVLMYIENFGNPSRFIEVGREITKTKPVFVVKSGRTGAGQRAAASHTGALAQTELATDAIIRQAGAIRAQSVNELFDYAMAFSNQPLPKGNRVAIVTNAGGPGIIIADACETNGLDVTALAEETQIRLKTKLPVEASVHNPVDMIASATAEGYRFALECVLDDPGVDAAIAAFVPPLGTHTKDVAQAIVDVAERQHEKPILAVLMGRQGLPAGLAELHEANVPGYLFPESAASALGAMWRYSKMQLRDQGKTIEFDTDDDTVAEILEATKKAGHEKLSEPDVFRILEAYGIPTAQWAYVPNEDSSGFEEAVRKAADEIEGRVALKVVSPDVTHKTDVGGVILGLESGEETAEAASKMAKKIAETGASIDGVVIQKMARRGRETIVGMTRIPTVGPMVMFGLGGVYVEVLQDVVLRLCPLLDTDAQEMIRQVKMVKILEGVRGEAPRDLDALAEIILRVSQLATRHEAISEMDINPVIAYERGALAVDARIQIG